MFESPRQYAPATLVNLKALPISPDEFKNFINRDIRLEPVVIGNDSSIDELLAFYMGKNTPTRQEFIIENLKVEKDFVEDEV